jgi:hypothetical protein
MTPEQEHACLGIDPFEGGKGDDTYRRLSDHFVVTVRTHTCSLCFGFIPIQTRCRRMADLDDGRVMTFYACPDCCAAMAAARDDDGRALEMRYALGKARRP